MLRWKLKLRSSLQLCIQPPQKQPKYRTLKKLKKVGRGIQNRNIALVSKESKQLFQRWKDTGRKCEVTKQQLKYKKLLRRYQRQAHATLKHKNINNIMHALESDDKLFYKLINKQRQTVHENAQTLKVCPSKQLNVVTTCSKRKLW